VPKALPPLLLLCLLQSPQSRGSNHLRPQRREGFLDSGVHLPFIFVLFQNKTAILPTIGFRGGEELKDVIEFFFLRDVLSRVIVAPVLPPTIHQDNYSGCCHSL